MERIVDQLIADYNHTEFSSESPHFKDKQSTIKNAILLKPEYKALLTWKRREYKVTKSQVIRRKGDQTIYYALPKHLRMAHANTRLHVAYHDEHLDFVFIYDRKYTFLAKLKRSENIEILYDQRSKISHKISYQTIHSREKLYKEVVEKHHLNSVKVEELKRGVMPLELIDFSSDKETEYETARAFTLKAYELEMENEISNIQRCNHIISSYKIDKNEIGKEL